MAKQSGQAAPSEQQSGTKQNRVGPTAIDRRRGQQWQQATEKQQLKQWTEKGKEVYQTSATKEMPGLGGRAGDQHQQVIEQRILGEQQRSEEAEKRGPSWSKGMADRKDDQQRTRAKG